MNIRSKRLNDYVKEKIDEAASNPLAYSPFGLETSGTCINKWAMSFANIELYSGAKGISDLTSSNYITITVPATKNGLIPLNETEQPFGWDGKINEYVAEMAVWWAFELLTEDEANRFLNKEEPSVVFNFFEKNRPSRLTVQFIDSRWIIIP